MLILTRLFASAMFSKLGVAWASSTLAFISIAFIPIPFILYKVRYTLTVAVADFWLTSTDICSMVAL